MKDARKEEEREAQRESRKYFGRRGSLQVRLYLHDWKTAD